MKYSYLVALLLAFPPQHVVFHRETKPASPLGSSSSCLISLSASPANLAFTPNPLGTVAPANVPLNIMVSWSGCVASPASQGGGVWVYTFLPSSANAFSGPIPLGSNALLASFGNAYNPCTVFSISITPTIQSGLPIAALIGAPNDNIFCQNPQNGFIGVVLGVQNPAMSGSASVSINLEANVNGLPSGQYTSTLTISGLLI